MPPKKQAANNNNNNNNNKSTTTAATTAASTAATTRATAAAIVKVATASKQSDNNDDVSKMSREELIASLARAEKNVEVHQRLLATLRESVADTQGKLIADVKTLSDAVAKLTQVVQSLADASAPPAPKKRLCFNCDQEGHALEQCPKPRSSATGDALSLAKGQQKRALRDAQRKRLLTVAPAAPAVAVAPAPAVKVKAPATPNYIALLPITLGDGKSKQKLLVDAMVSTGSEVNTIRASVAARFHAAKRDNTAVGLQFITSKTTSLGAIALTVTTPEGVPTAPMWFQIVPDSHMFDVLLCGKGIVLSIVGKAGVPTFVTKTSRGTDISTPFRIAGPDAPLVVPTTFFARD